jgi:hypothetical protein
MSSRVLKSSQEYKNHKLIEILFFVFLLFVCYIRVNKQDTIKYKLKRPSIEINLFLLASLLIRH